AFVITAFLLAVRVGVVGVGSQRGGHLPVTVKLNTIDFRIADVKILVNAVCGVTVVYAFLRGRLGTDGVVADFVLKLGVEKGRIQRQRVLLPVHAHLSVHALFWLQIVI